MTRAFNKKQFDNISKFVYYFLVWSVRALFVLAGLLVVAMLVFMFIPKDLLNWDMGNLEHINIQFANVMYEINPDFFTGVVNVKWLLVFLSFVGVVNIGFIQYVQILLKKIIRDVKEQTPFTESNVYRLKLIGYGYIGAAIILPFLTSMLLMYGINLLNLFQANANFSVNVQSVFMGIIILVLAGIFDYGSYLQEDHDMTV